MAAHSGSRSAATQAAAARVVSEKTLYVASGPTHLRVEGVPREHRVGECRKRIARPFRLKYNSARAEIPPAGNRLGSDYREIDL